MTGLQRTTLSDAANRSIYQRRFGYGAWRIMGGNPSVVGKLISMGLAKWGDGDGDRKDLVLTDAGRECIR